MNDMLLRNIRVLCTSNCNLKCYFCCHEGYVSHGNGLNAPNLSRFCDAVQAKIGVEGIKFTGGEPLMHPNITDLVASVMGRFQITIVTNGTYPEKLQELVSATRALRVVVSVPAISEEKYDLVTHTNGLYERVMSSLDFLHKEDIDTRVNVVLTKQCLAKDLRAIIRWANQNRERFEVRFIQLCRNKLNRRAVEKKAVPLEPIIQARFNAEGYLLSRDSRSTLLFRNSGKEHSFAITKSFCHDGCYQCPSDKRCVWLAADGNVRSCAWGNKPDHQLQTWETAELDRVATALRDELSAHGPSLSASE